MPANEPEIKIEICDACGRDFVVDTGEDPHDETGVVFCPECRPEY